jgi:NADH-quinone oxidoreductase subunit K
MQTTQTQIQTQLQQVLNLPLNEQLLTSLSSAGNPLPTWLIFSFLLFFAGLLGMISNPKNYLVTMMSVELMYLGAVSSFVLYGVICRDVRGAVYGLVLLILAACESAVGLGILIVLYRFEKSIDFSTYQELGG